MTKNILRSLFPSRSRGGSPSNSAPASHSGSRSATPAPSQPASRSPSPAPVPASSYANLTFNLTVSPGSTPGSSRAPSPSPFSLAASLPPNPSHPAAPGTAPGSSSGSNSAGPEPTPAPQSQAQPKRKISVTRVAQLHTLLAILNLTKASLQQEQESMADILLATTVTHAESRIPSPESQDIDLLALASNACRARRYFLRVSSEEDEEEGGPSLTGLEEEKEHWRGVVDELGRKIERLEKEVEDLEREREVLEGSW